MFMQMTKLEYREKFVLKTKRQSFANKKAKQIQPV